MDKINGRYNFTKEVVEQIKDLYVNKKLSVLDIQDLLLIGSWSIYNCLRKNGIKIRSKFEFCQKYKIDDSFFEKIDSHEKAYWLGWLYADGCVFISKKGFMFHLTLQNKDSYIVEEFKKALKTDIPIFKMKRKPQSGLFVWNKKLCTDLINLGCVPKKSLILKFPTEDQVPNEFIPSFIHGYFDGDGSVSFRRKNRRVEANIISSVDFCRGYIEYIKKAIGVKNFYITRDYSKHEHIEYQRIGFGKYSNMESFYKLIYKNQPGLIRKKQIFEEIIQWIKEKQFL